jgi:hypothetical protein
MRDILLLYRYEEAAKNRQIARDSGDVDSWQMSLLQLAFRPLRQGGYVMPQDADVVKIVRAADIARCSR